MTQTAIGIASYEEMKARTLAIARGDLKPAPEDPRVWATSPDALAKVVGRTDQVNQPTRPGDAVQPPHPPTE